MATFGRRTHVPGAPVAKSAVRKPWLTWVLAALVACIIAGGSLLLPRVLVQDDGPTVATEAAPNATLSETEFAHRFVALATAQPDEAERQMTAAVEACLPEAARPYWSGPIKPLAVEFLVRSLSLKYDSSATVEQTDQQFRAWVISSIDGLTDAQREQFKRLANIGLQADTMPSCLVAAIYHSSRPD